MTEIKNPFLAWIGNEFYPTFEAFAKEAVEQGVSKRLPTVAMAESLMAEGTVVFLAHDDGLKECCPDCTVERGCPECKGRGFEAGGDKGGDPGPLCECCAGTGKVNVGTGGMGVVDGEVLDFTTLWGRKKHPKKYDLADKEIEEHPCPTCGGFGKLPKGRVMGMFIPDGVEYVLRPEDTEEAKKALEEKGIKTLTMGEVARELKRGCGYRKPGGVYLVTRTKGKPSKTLKDVIEALVKAGKVQPDGVDVKGSFVTFVNPVEIHGVKRFRGMKRWSMDPAAEGEAELILDAKE